MVEADLTADLNVVACTEELECKGDLHVVGTTTQRITVQVEARVHTSVAHPQVSLDQEVAEVEGVGEVCASTHDGVYCPRNCQNGAR